MSVWAEAESAFLNWQASGSEFACAYCQIFYQDEASLTYHTEGVHKVPFWKYTADNPNYASLRNSEWCRICEKEMSNIGIHLKEEHMGMTTELYFMRFVFETVGNVEGISSSNLAFKETQDPTYSWDSNDLQPKVDLTFSNPIQEILPSQNIFSANPNNFSSRDNGPYEPALGNTETSNSTSKEKTISHDKAHKCPHCSFATRQGSHLRRHLRRHTGEMPYECKHCGKKFANNASLDQHLPKHTGMWKYSCSVCGKGFAQKCDWKKHSKNHL